MPAPSGVESKFFSNNSEIEETAQKAGWTFHFLESEPISEDYLVSSLQSKKVKFLEFMTDKELQHSNEILYVDHSVLLNTNHISLIQKRCDKDILIRNTPRQKTTIYDEIESARGQERYERYLDQTLNWLQIKNSEGYSMAQRIMNTGLIYYKNPKNIINLVRNVYQDCLRLQQPECQIIWAVHSQDYQMNIRRIEWDTIGIPHKS